MFHHKMFCKCFKPQCCVCMKKCLIVMGKRSLGLHGNCMGRCRSVWEELVSPYGERNLMGLFRLPAYTYSCWPRTSENHMVYTAPIAFIYTSNCVGVSLCGLVCLLRLQSLSSCAKYTLKVCCACGEHGM